MTSPIAFGLAPGLAVPEAATNDEAGNRANGSGLRDHNIEPQNCRQSLRSPQADKAFEAARARAALGGFQLHRLAAADRTRDEYLILRWSMSVALPDLGAVVQFLDRVGVVR